MTSGAFQGVNTSATVGSAGSAAPSRSLWVCLEERAHWPAADSQRRPEANAKVKRSAIHPETNDCFTISHFSSFMRKKNLHLNVVQTISAHRLEDAADGVGHRRTPALHQQVKHG